MKGKLRKFTQIALLAVILGAALLPSVVLAQGTGTTTTPAATTAAAAPQTAAPSSQTAEAVFLGNIVVRGISSLVGTLIELFGKLTIQLIDILVQVAQYNGYMDSPAITTGWVIVRDIANLFFVALILVVSIGSIVNPDKFGGAKQVFRILLFALFVNFSRFIAALCIDVSQLVMLTFVNGFAQAAGGNFTEALGVTKLTELAAGGALTPTAAVAGIFMALFMFVVITVIIGVMVVALIVRMVTLWVLVVVSPLAFACGASSITKPHYDGWWKQFTAELTTGPIVAFFLWLSLVSLQGTTGSGVTGQVLQGTSGGKTAVNISCGETAACSEENMIRFIVAAAMLLTGLGFAKQFSGVGGELAKKAGDYGGQKVRGFAYGVARRAALPAAGFLAAGPAGVAAVGGITLARESTFGRQAANRARGFIGKTLGGGNSVGNVVGRIPVLGDIGRGLTVSAGKKREELLKEARERTKGLNDDQRNILFKSRLEPQIVKDAIALDIVKNKTYNSAIKDDPDPKKAANYKDFELAVQTLDKAGKGGDKDSADKVKDIKEARPDIAAVLSADKKPDGSLDEDKILAKINSSGFEADMDKLKKIDFDAMSEKRRNEFFKGMRPELLNAFYDKGSSSKEKGYIENYRYNAETQLLGDALRDGFRSGTLKIENQSAMIREDGKEPRPNVELAVETVKLGNATQMQALKGKTDTDKIRKAIEDGLKERVDFNTGAGLVGSGDKQRMADENLREAETAVILGGDASDLYKLKSDGRFAGSAAKNSFNASVGSSSPKRLDFVLSLSDKDIKGDVARSLYENLTPDDLDVLARRAKTGDEVKTMKEIVKQSLNEAKKDFVFVEGAKKDPKSDRAEEVLNRIGANPNLNKFA